MSAYTGARAEELVLLSGGIDSVCLLADRIAHGARPRTLFVDYGQPPAASERSASQLLARRLGVDWDEVRVEGIMVPDGEIVGRNALFVHLGLCWLGGGGPQTIGIGIHAGTSYRDCSPEFVAETQRSLDLQSGGEVTLIAPYVTWSKQLVVERACELKVPFELTHSCERSDVPCGACLSCLDRSELVARS